MPPRPATHRCAACERNTSFVNPFPEGRVVCSTCLKRLCVTATEATKAYRLDKTVLSALPRWTTSSIYHPEVNRFEKTTVEALAVARYGTTDPDAIATHARNDAIAAMGLPAAFVAFWTAHSDHVRGIKAGYARFEAFEALAARSPSATEEDRVDFVIHGDDGGVEARIKEREAYAVRAPARERRRAALVAALAERGLELRADSAVGDEFIEHGRRSLHHVVSIAENMRFLYDHTEYAKILDGLHAERRQARREEREMVRYLGDVYDNAYAYDDDDERENNIDLSRRAQAEAMAKYTGPVGDVPDGLRPLLSPAVCFF